MSRDSGRHSWGQQSRRSGPGSGLRSWVCLLQEHFHTEDLATLRLRPSQDLTFLSKADLAGMGCLKRLFISTPVPACYPVLLLEARASLTRVCRRADAAGITPVKTRDIS